MRTFTQRLGRSLFDRPYLLLSLTQLFWAGNIVLGRHVAGHVPPIGLAWARWIGAFLLILPFAWPHLTRDWPQVRRHAGRLALIALTGVSAYNALAYWGLQQTEALNALLIQSAGPLLVGLWTFALYRDVLTPRQICGVVVSLAGVAVIITRGELAALAQIRFNAGDLILFVAILDYALFSALLRLKPAIHWLSFVATTVGMGAVMLTPAAVWEMAQGRTLQFDGLTLATLGYVVVFPSTLAYVFFNRGVELIGANRAAPFFHLISLFGAILAIGLLGERPAPFHAVGFALVLAGVWTAARQGRNPPAVTPPPG